MKLPLKMTGVLLIFALLTSCVAATENKDLPTKEEITDFIAGISVSDNYIITVFDTVKDKQPAWNCDTWVDKNGNQILSLYYVDPDSAKGYGSIYFNKLGKEISTRGVEVKLVNHYVGKAGSEEKIDDPVLMTEETGQTTEETGQTADDTVQTDEYKELLDESEELLDEYKEQLAKSEGQSVKYNNQPITYKDPSGEDDSQSVENVAKTVENVSQTVEDVAKTVENVAHTVEDEEETKWNKKILTEIFIGLAVCFIAYKLGWNK